MISPMDYTQPSGHCYRENAKNLLCSQSHGSNIAGKPSSATISPLEQRRWHGFPKTQRRVPVGTSLVHPRLVHPRLADRDESQSGRSQDDRSGQTAPMLPGSFTCKSKLSRVSGNCVIVFSERTKHIAIDCLTQKVGSATFSSRDGAKGASANSQHRFCVQT